MLDEDLAASRCPRQWNVHREAEYSRGCKKVSASGNRADVREVCTTKAAKIRRNFNISRRRERAECNPLDKRLPPPWCPLTNRGHRFRAELRRQGRPCRLLEERRVSRTSNGTSRYAREKNRRKPSTSKREKNDGACWMRSKKFCRALSPKQIARLRRTGRRLRHNCGGRDRLTLGSAPFRHCRLSFIRVVAAEKCRGDSSLTFSLVGAMENVCGGNGRVIRATNRVFATREPFISRVGIMVPDFEPRAFVARH